MSSELIRAVDLFCGGGGCSTGFARAAERLDRPVQLAAVNHWEPAIETHERNHPWADHYHCGVEQLDPREIYPDGDIDILIAAPECTHFSKARGGTPINPQKRMAPFAIMDWVARLRPRTILVENVPEFQAWGPVVDGSATRNGTFFEAWSQTIEDLGYSVAARTLVAADYGDPTTRERLFVIARRDDHPVWPEPTHSEEGGDGTEPWRTAAEIIDWSERGQSIWTRGLQGNGKRPLAANTMQRIAEGIRRYGDDRLEPFADAIATLDPDAIRAMQQSAVDVAEAEAAVEKREEPFLVRAEVFIPQTGGDEQVVEPRMGLCGPFIKGQHGGSVPRDVHEDPVMTVTCDGNIPLIRPEAFVLPRNQFYRGTESNPAYDPGERPLHTVTASNHDGHVVAPYLVVYNGESDATAIDEPLPTVTTRDRFGLVVPELYPWGLDVEYRMLQPRELAAAQGFPEDYDFAGDTKADVTEQIGNAVPVHLATALCEQLLTAGGPTLDSFFGTSDSTASAVPDGGEADD
jgi:DNA (cytosine-5)-methyltransferase 1